jgi:hypothetical protein
VTSLSVQSTTLDDVFAHYTGHQLRDALQSAAGNTTRPFTTTINNAMHRIWAIIERDLRRFRRSPTLVVVSIIMPLMQLVVLGYAFGGKIKNLEIGVVDQDHGVPAVGCRRCSRPSPPTRAPSADPLRDQSVALPTCATAGSTAC